MLGDAKRLFEAVSARSRHHLYSAWPPIWGLVLSMTLFWANIPCKVPFIKKTSETCRKDNRMFKININGVDRPARYFVPDAERDYWMSALENAEQVDI